MAQKFNMAIVLVNNSILNFKNKQVLSLSKIKTTPALCDYWN